MRNANVHVVNIFCMICFHIYVKGSVWHKHSSEFYLSTWMVKVRFNICEQVITS